MIKLLHRGDTLNYPENTIESIKSALNNINYNGFEIDLQLTKDDKWIIFHDGDTKRLTNKNLIIKNTNYNDLPLIKFKDKYFKIPLLKDLTYLKNSMKIFNLEIKEKLNISYSSKNNLLNLIKLIKSPLIISSYNWKWYDWCVDNNLNFAHLIENDDLPKNGEFWIIDYKILNEKIINKIKEKNIKIGCYTLKNKQDINYNYDVEIWDNN